jgi:hypothetical protein
VDLARPRDAPSEALDRRAQPAEAITPDQETNEIAPGAGQPNRDLTPEGFSAESKNETRPLLAWPRAIPDLNLDLVWIAPGDFTIGTMGPNFLVRWLDAAHEEFRWIPGHGGSIPGERLPPAGVPLDFAVELAWNFYNDRRTLQLELIDWRPSQPA